MIDIGPVAGKLFATLSLLWAMSEIWLGWSRRSSDPSRSRDSGTLRLLLVMLPVTVAFLWRIRIEEQVLADAFPSQYPEYARQTRRLIPFVW